MQLTFIKIIAAHVISNVQTNKHFKNEALEIKPFTLKSHPQCAQEILWD